MDPKPQSPKLSAAERTEGAPAPAPAPAPVRARPSLLRRLLPFGLGLGVAFATSRMMASGEDEASSQLFAPTATLLGTAVPSGPSAPATVRASLRAYLRAPLRLTLGAADDAANDGARTTTREALGARIDEERLDAMLRDLGDPGSAMMRSSRPSKDGRLELPLPIVLDPKAAFAAMVSLKEDLDKPAQDAKLDLDARKVIAEKPGRRIDVYATMASLDEALRRGDGEVLVASVEVEPALTHEKLADVELGDTLGYFETKYATDQKHVDRTFNLRLAASHLNGKVILPGETFDFNAVVGPRDEAHGYRVAKVIADGELVDGMGGGTCQVAGTLHGAALFAGLEVVKRTPHTRPSYYIKMGLDAAVAYPSITLTLRNPFTFPVVLKETVTGGVVRAEILGPKRTRVVTFIRKIEEVTPFSEREVPDERLPDGARVVTQRGIPGFKVRRYRIVRDGANAVREKTIDTYPPTLQIVHVGTGAPGKKPTLSTDDHPEYVADAYLAITQGPGIGRASQGGDELKGGAALSGMEEVRIAGETGTKGWTRKYTAKSADEAAAPKVIAQVDLSDASEDAPADAGACEGETCAAVAKKSEGEKRRKK